MYPSNYYGPSRNTGYRYGGDYQDYDRNRNVAIEGGLPLYEVGYNRGYGSNQPQQIDYFSGSRNYGYGPSVREYESNITTTRRGPCDSYYGGGGNVGKHGYRKGIAFEDEQQRGRVSKHYGSKYSTKKKTYGYSSTSSSSSDNEEPGMLTRAADKIKSVFKGGHEDDIDNEYYGGKYNKDRSYRRGSVGYVGDKQQHSYGVLDKLASLRGRSEVAPSMSQGVSGEKALMWQFNVKGFDLDDIHVSDVGNNKLEISGHHEDAGAHHRHSRQFTRIITLPEGSNAKEVKSSVTGRGLLTVTVPYSGKNWSSYGTRELPLKQGSSSIRQGTPGTATATTTAARTAYGNNNNDAPSSGAFATTGHVGGGAYSQQQQTSTTTTRHTAANA